MKHHLDLNQRFLLTGMNDMCETGLDSRCFITCKCLHEEEGLTKQLPGHGKVQLGFSSHAISGVNSPGALPAGLL